MIRELDRTRGLSIVTQGPVALLGQASGSCSMQTGYWPSRDTGRAMSEESETPDHVELIRGYLELMDRTWDPDALEDTGLFSPGVVWDLSGVGLGVYEGTAGVGDSSKAGGPTGRTTITRSRRFANSGKALCSSSSLKTGVPWAARHGSRRAPGGCTSGPGARSPV